MNPFLKLTQLLTALAVIVLFLLIYPGAMTAFAIGVGTIYVLAAIGAIWKNRFAVWLALIFSTVTAILSSMAVYRFHSIGYNFLTGSFDQSSGFYLQPYLFLAIAIAAVSVVVAHVISWRRLVLCRLKVAQ